MFGLPMFRRELYCKPTQIIIYSNVSFLDWCDLGELDVPDNSKESSMHSAIKFNKIKMRLN